MLNMSDLEKDACTPTPLAESGFNRRAVLPYGCAVEHIQLAMQDFLNFIGFINHQLRTQRMTRLESLLMPASFSGIVSEFVASQLPAHCPDLVRNRRHNGRPDLLPKGFYADDAILNGQEGIEIKASRYQRGWQGHNAEAGWLMIFCFESNTSSGRTIQAPMPFRFTFVACAYLTAEDWSFSGRSATSRRTITASVTRTGYAKLLSNWLYRV
jgi:hypothetical protein